MEVVEGHTAFLSDYEVMKHLAAQRSERDKIATNIGRPVRAAENVQTIEFETLSYLEKKCSEITEERLKKIMEYLADLQLTKAEKLQIINILPKTHVEFYLIVEECEERFASEKIDEILERIDEILERVEEVVKEKD